MIQLYFNEQVYIYDCFHIVKAFFPEKAIKQEIVKGNDIVVRIDFENIILLQISELELAKINGKRARKRFVNKKIYKEISKQTGRALAWGILTGIRPTKIVMKLLEEGKEREEVLLFLQEEYYITKEKANLAWKIAKKEKAILEKLDYEEGFSLYVGIPFCPTTCSYCSFTSYPLEEWKSRVDEYLETLCQEIFAIGRMTKNKKLNTIYIGGGTPTTLEAEQLDRLLFNIETTFSYEYLKEITVEAGRPDSITKEKLEVLRRHQISRISINPQTMNQKTLDIIGRKHTADEVKQVYAMAREVGIDNINMDLIAGLPEETAEDFRNTLKEIQKLKPDNLTIHSLAKKRAAQMEHREVNEGAKFLLEMITLGGKAAKEMDLEPYYLYRQKNSAGNFENVGYAFEGKESIYNILIMEEKQTIIAVGVGGITKVVLKDKSAKQQIMRIENVKDIHAYMKRVDEMIARKAEWLWH